MRLDLLLAEAAHPAANDPPGAHNEPNTSHSSTASIAKPSTKPGLKNIASTATDTAV